VTADRFRPLWDLLDLQGTEARLRGALDAETADARRAEVLTQVGRVLSLQGEHQRAHELIDEADELSSGSGVAHIRVLLERGRILRLAGDPGAALPLFEAAYHAALDAGEDFLAGDAAHMCALAGDVTGWSQRGLQLAARSPDAAVWRRTLLVNLGRWQWQQGAKEDALESFQAALEIPEHPHQYPFLREFARYGAGRALRALGQPQDAIPLLEQAVEWANDSGFSGEEANAFRAELDAARADLRNELNAAPKR
jgi:tetratricopeptide (TPR) repeat protein